ncbi:MAG TPA: glycosyl transferase family 2, partial [Thermoplasmatales archaeon]|nr:glycosyl transferase family 2 [Thermoplasmatales archaeon]
MSDSEKADIVVGILCKNVEATILHVMNVVNDGLHRYFSEHKKAMVVSDGYSSDRTKELAELFQPYEGVKKIIT